MNKNIFLGNKKLTNRLPFLVIALGLLFVIIIILASPGSIISPDLKDNNRFILVNRFNSLCIRIACERRGLTGLDLGPGKDRHNRQAQEEA